MEVHFARGLPGIFFIQASDHLCISGEEKQISTDGRLFCKYWKNGQVQAGCYINPTKSTSTVVLTPPFLLIGNDVICCGATNLYPGSTTLNPIGNTKGPYGKTERKTKFNPGGLKATN